MTIKRRFVVALTALAAGSLAIALASPANADPDPTLTDAYSVVGSTTVGSIGSTVPLGPTTLTETLDLNTLQILSGTLPFPSQQVQFNALGFIPIRATISLVQTSPVTGSLTNVGPRKNVITATVDYTIKLSNISVLVAGYWQSLYVGPNCQTINPVSITASTPAGGNFNVSSGGQLTGTYTIGNFQNCAPLNLPDVFGVGSLLVNALVPGSNNTVNLTVSDGVYVSSTG